MSFFFCWTQKKIFWRRLVTKQLTVAIDFHSMDKILYKSMATINCLVTIILQNTFCCVQQKKETHIWVWVNDDRIFILGWTIPLSVSNNEYFKKFNQLTLTSMTCFLLDFLWMPTQPNYLAGPLQIRVGLVASKLEKQGEWTCLNPVTL